VICRWKRGKRKLAANPKEKNLSLGEGQLKESLKCESILKEKGKKDA